MQIPASNLRADRFPRFVVKCRAEVDELLTETILRSPRLKTIAQKIELLVRVSPPPVIILAIDDLGLHRMKLQPAFLHARGYRCPHLPRLHLCPAMHDRVSSPGEFHPEALSEPYLNLSAHTAPAMEPRRTPICQ